MSYTINKTDGSVLTEIVDGSVDTVATDLTLVGKNATSYGEAFNENFIKLLENFASSSEPNHSIIGQLWYDTTDGRLKVYTGTGFKVTGGTIVSSTAPTNLVQGDLWIDTARQQLYFYDGSALFLAGPDYSADQGVSGIQINTILDDVQKEHTIGILYISSFLIGIFSKDTFTPSPAIPGYTGTIRRGFNIGNDSGLEFNVNVSVASALRDDNNIDYTPNDFVKTAGSSSISLDENNEGTLTIQSSIPLILGESQDTEIRATASKFELLSSDYNQDFEFKVKTLTGNQGFILYNPGTFSLFTTVASGTGTTVTLTFASQVIPPFPVGSTINVDNLLPAEYNGSYEVTACTTTQVSYLCAATGSQTFPGNISQIIDPRLGIREDLPAATLDVNGTALIRSDLTVQGDLTIQGTTTSVSTTNTVITDNIITLNNGETSSGITLGSAGIEIDRGSSIKATWKFYDSPDVAWRSNYYVDLKPDTGIPLNLAYRINGESVLSFTTLGSSVVHSSLTSVGTLVELQVDDININGDVVSSGTGNIDVDSARISNLATIAYNDSSPPLPSNLAQMDDAISQQTLQNYMMGVPIYTTLELTNNAGGDLSDSDVATILTTIYPVIESAIGRKIYVHCTKTLSTYDGISITTTVTRTLRTYILAEDSPNFWDFADEVSIPI